MLENETFKQMYGPTKDTVNERLHDFPHYTQHSCGGQVTKFNVMISLLRCEAVQFGKVATKFQMNMMSSFTQKPKISGSSFL